MALARGRVYAFGPFRLDPARRRLTSGGAAVPLTARLFDLLLLLLEQRDRAISRAQLMELLWPGTTVEENNISVNVSALRKALGESLSERRFIETLPRVGYRFVAEVTELEGLEREAAAMASGATPSAAKHADTRLGFVGREGELERLESLLARALAGSGRVVFITGEIGIGKTALAECFVARVLARGERWLVARGRCVEQYGPGEAYLPFLDAWSGLLSGPAASSARTALGKHAPTWCTSFPAAFAGAGDGVGPRRDGRGASRQRRLREMGDALAALARTTPLILLLEDLHWADPSSVDLLRLLAQRLDLGGLLVLGTLRGERLGLARHPLRNAKRELFAHDLCDEVELTGLSETQVERLIDERFAPNDFAHELARSLLRRTEGHALFVTRLIQLLDERGDVVCDERGFKLVRPLSDIDLAIPNSVRGVILSELELLDPSDRRALQHASVEGQEFSSTVLASILDVDELALEERLAAIAQEPRLILASGEEQLPDGRLTTRYRFSHVLYQNVLYESLIKKRRMHLHLRVGDVLLEQQPGDSSSIAAQLALHFECARDYARAIFHLQRAGENSSRLHASEEAKTFYTHALELSQRLAAGDPARLEATLHEKRGWVHFHRGELELAHADFEQTRERARAAGNLESEGAALTGLCRTLLNAHRLDEMEARAREALKLAEAAKSERLHIEALVLLAQKQGVEGELVRAVGALDEAILTARRLRHESVLLTALVWRGMLHFFQSEYGAAVASCLEAEDLARELGSADLALLALYFRGLSQANLGQIGESFLALDQAERLGRENADRQTLPKIPNARGWIYRELGDLGRAIEHDEESLALARRYELTEVETHSVLNLAADHLNLRDEALARAAFGEADGLIRRTAFGRWRNVLRLLAIRGEASLLGGRLEEAEQCGQRLLQDATETQARKYAAVAHTLLGRIAAARGALGAGRVWFERALELARRYPMPLFGWRLWALFGRLELQSGDRRAAERAFRESAEVAARIGAGIFDAALRARFEASVAALCMPGELTARDDAPPPGRARS